MALIGALNIMLGLDAAQVAAGSKRARESLKTIDDQAAHSARTLGAMKTVMGAIGVGVGAFEAVSFLKSSVEEYRAAEQQQRKLAAVLDSTGHAAGFTADQLGQLNKQLQAETNFDDDAIAGAEAVLATFKGIQGTQFSGAVDSILDLSAVLGQDLQSSALQLGKALNDPVRGITALRRAGVSFTAEQQDQIKAMVAAGDVVAAQKTILAELKSEFGGAAKAMRDDFTALANTWGDFKESVGALAATDASQGALLGISEAVRQLTAGLENAAKASAVATQGLEKLSTTERATSATLRVLSNIVTLGNSGDIFGAEVQADNRDLEQFQKKYAELVAQGKAEPVTLGVRSQELGARSQGALPQPIETPVQPLPGAPNVGYAAAADALEKLNDKLREEQQLQGLTGTAREIAALQLQGLTDAELADTRALAAANDQRRASSQADTLVTKLREEIALHGLTSDALAIEKLRRQGATEATLAQAEALSRQLAALEQHAAAQKAADDAAADLRRDLADTRRELEQQIATFGKTANEARLFELSTRSAAEAQTALAAGQQLAALEQQKAALQDQAVGAAELHAQLDRLNAQLATERNPANAAIDRERAQQLAAQAAAADRAAQQLADLAGQEKALREQQAAAGKSAADLDAARAADEKFKQLEALKKAAEDQQRAADKLAESWQALYEETRTPAEHFDAELKKLTEMHAAFQAQVDRDAQTSALSQDDAASVKQQADDTFERGKKRLQEQFGDTHAKPDRPQTAAVERGSAEAYSEILRFQTPGGNVPKQTLDEIRALRREMSDAAKEQRRKDNPAPIRRL